MWAAGCGLPVGVHDVRERPGNRYAISGPCAGDAGGVGAIAQLVERLHGMQEVSGSSPLSSTPGQRPFSRSRERAFFVLRGTLRGKIVAAPCGLDYP